MNKLRKPRPQGAGSGNQSIPPQWETSQRSSSAWTVTSSTSRTLQYATAVEYNAPKTFASDSVSLVRPQTQREQYWAVRALVAETLLSNKIAHNEEVRRIISSGGLKRSREISEIRTIYEKGQSKLERFTMILFGILCTFMILTLGVLLKNHPQPQESKRPPAHFTIPILSPFTSVIEHEMSTVSSRTLACLVLFGSVLLYAIYRHWIGRIR